MEDYVTHKDFLLLHCSIRLHREAPEAVDIGVGATAADVIRVKHGGHHFTYAAMTFDGDSGGAVILAENCEVVGIHQSTVNAAVELLEQAESLQEQLTAAQQSIKSLVGSTSSGAVALRVDIQEISRYL